MWRGRWLKVAKICGYAVGLGNLILLVLGGPTILTLGVAVVLADSLPGVQSGQPCSR